MELSNRCLSAWSLGSGPPTHTHLNPAYLTLPQPHPYPSQEFYGGADIVMETAVNGQLKEALEVAMLE